MQRVKECRETMRGILKDQTSHQGFIHACTRKHSNFLCIPISLFASLPHNFSPKAQEFCTYMTTTFSEFCSWSRMATRTTPSTLLLSKPTTFFGKLASRCQYSQQEEHYDSRQQSHCLYQTYFATQMDCGTRNYSQPKH